MRWAARIVTPGPHAGWHEQVEAAGRRQQVLSDLVITISTYFKGAQRAVRLTARVVWGALPRTGIGVNSATGLAGRRHAPRTAPAGPLADTGPPAPPWSENGQGGRPGTPDPGHRPAPAGRRHIHRPRPAPDSAPCSRHPSMKLEKLTAACR